MQLSQASVFHSDGFPLAVIGIKPQIPMALHSHEFHELVLILGGSGLHLTGGQAFPVKAGDAFVINGRRQHGYQDTRELMLTNILYKPDLLEMPVGRLRDVPGYHVLFTLEPAYHKRHGFVNRVHLSLGELSRISGWAEALEKELKDRTAGFRFVATALFMQIVGFLSRAYERSSRPASAELIRIARVISHLESRYEHPVTLNELAGVAHMSLRNLTRVFCAVTGHPPIDYLIRLRLTRAAEHLRRSDAKIIEVAYAAGFQDSNYFARQFRRVMGLSPSQFRRLENPGGEALEETVSMPAFEPTYQSH